MRKFVYVLCLALVIFSLPQWAVADTISTVGYYGPYQTGSGGEFTLLPGSSGGLGSYSGLASGFVQAGTIQTFCIEENEYIYPNTTYSYSISNAAVAGGLGGQSPFGSGRDPISKGTAFLYYMFATGQLEIYGYDYTPASRLASAAALQNAIWYLEDEGGSNNYYVALAESMLGNLTEAQVKADNEGLYPVAVLNLTIPGCRAQDQLVLTPEPLTLILLGLGLVGVAGLRRKDRV